VLNDIAFGAFAENPPRKDAIPFAVTLIFDHQLHKGAGFRRIFPWRGGFTGAQPHQHISDTLFGAGLHRQFRYQAVALVQQAQLGDPLVHRRDAVNILQIVRQRSGFFQFHRNRLRGLFLVALAASCQHKGRDQRGRCACTAQQHIPAHSAPGCQA
jgi:hypothetical protein